MKDVYTNTVKKEVPPIDLRECCHIAANFRGDMINTFMGCPVRVVSGLNENEWFIGISAEMFDELERKRV